MQDVTLTCQSCLPFSSSRASLLTVQVSATPKTQHSTSETQLTIAPRPPHQMSILPSLHFLMSANDIHISQSPTVEGRGPLPSPTWTQSLDPSSFLPTNPLRSDCPYHFPGAGVIFPMTSHFIFLPLQGCTLADFGHLCRVTKAV